MSTYTQVRVYCDEEGCGRSFNLSSNTGGLTRAWAVRRASDEGWAITKGGNIARCPAHRKPLKTHAFVSEGWVGCKAKVANGWCWKPAHHPVHGGQP